METTDQEIKCPKCNNMNVRRSGRGWRNKIRYVCKDCWKTFQLEDENTGETK